MMAPEPVLTSSTTTSQPAASFFREDGGDDQRQAVHRFGDVAQGVEHLVRRGQFGGLAGDGAADGADDGLELVHLQVDAHARDGLELGPAWPPVKPSPRPDIFATLRPQAAARGTRMRLVVSPTPPVECLSALTPGMSFKSSVSPDLAMASVSASVSRSLMPWMQMAISRAEV